MYKDHNLLKYYMSRQILIVILSSSVVSLLNVSFKVILTVLRLPSWQTRITTGGGETIAADEWSPLLARSDGYKQKKNARV